MLLKCLWRFFALFFLSISIVSGSSAQTPENGSPKNDAGATSVFSLTDLYKIALQHAEQIKIAEKELLIAEKDEDRAFAVLVPSLTAFGEYKRYDEAKISFPESSQACGARLDQRFTLNGRELTGFQIAKDNIEKSRFDLDDARTGYLFNVAAAYYSVLKNQKGLEIAESDVKRLTAYKKAIQLRLDLKDTPKTELYRAEAELSGSETALVAAANRLRYSRITLARLVKLPMGYELELPDQIKSERDYPSTEQLIKTALAKRVDLKSLYMADKISESEIDYYQGAHWPTLSLEGVYTGLDSEPESYYPDEDSLHVGLSLNFPIFEGGLRSAEVSQARARKRQVELRLKDLAKQVRVEVEQTWLELQTAESAMASLEDRLKSAQENYTAVSQRYQHGLADSLDVIDANSLLLQSEEGLLEAKYNYMLSVLNLERAEGIFLDNIREKIRKQSPEYEGENDSSDLEYEGEDE